MRNYVASPFWHPRLFLLHLTQNVGSDRSESGKLNRESQPLLTSTGRLVRPLAPNIGECMSFLIHQVSHSARRFWLKDVLKIDAYYVVKTFIFSIKPLKI